MLFKDDSQWCKGKGTCHEISRIISVKIKNKNLLTKNLNLMLFFSEDFEKNSSDFFAIW